MGTLYYTVCLLSVFMLQNKFLTPCTMHDAKNSQSNGKWSIYTALLACNL